MKRIAILALSILALTACRKPDQEAKDRQAVEQQQGQYAKSQPVPAFDWSLERHLVVQLYEARNMRAATHSVWRSDLGQIEGDCPSIGYGVPYDTSLTNPLKETSNIRGMATIEQAEPNGIYASKNTAATWVMCSGVGGVIEPVYVETKVTSYPYPITVDYDRNRVKRNGASTVRISPKAD